MSLYNTSTCPLWDYDDFTPCSRQYIETYSYLVVGVVSSATLALKSLQSYIKTKKHIQLEDETRPLLAHSDAYGAIDVPKKELSIKSRHFDIQRLSDTKDDGTPHGHIEEVNKGLGDRFRVCFEFVLVMFQLASSISLLFVKDFQREFVGSYIPFIKSLFWAYAFLVVTIRVINMRNTNIRMPSLWAHSTFIYFFLFFPSLLTFRSAIVGHIPNSKLKTYYIVEFIASALLLALNFTAKVADKPAKLYFTSDGVTPSPENISSITSFITYSWIDSMVRKAYKKPLAMSDIWGLRQDDYALPILKSFEGSKSTVRFTYKLFLHFKLLFAVQAFWAMVDSFLVFVPSLLLKKILEYVEDPTSMPKSLAWTFVFLMPIFKLADSISSGCSLFLGRRVCVRMKAIIIGQVYAKALRRKITVTETIEDKKTENKVNEDADVKSDKENAGDSKKTAELGAIINLMAIDAFKVSEICGYLHFFVSSILMIFICIFLLYNLLGWSALVGALAIFVLLPFNYKIAVWVGELQKSMLAITDKRIQKLNETLQSIRIIKFFAWENNFFDSIMEIRKEELYQLKLRSLVWCLGAFNWFITPTLITLLAFYCYTLVEGRTLSAPIAFTALSLFTLLRAPLDQLADMTSLVIQSKVSLDRVGEFLNENETSKYDQLNKDKTSDSPEVGFSNATFSWNASSKNDFKLRDMDIKFKSGKLNVIIGPTGSGKTSLLLALLGEMDLLAGRVFLPGIIPRDELVIDPQTGYTDSVAYCAQTPWLLNDTIKNNIVFAAPFNQDRYDKVVDACGLTRDFQILSAGDSTEIGEKGITLSGGQKQRVSLARALYSNSKHVLLDDCLSAVDSHTALWIYENCVSGSLMEGRTCILVSHNVALTVQKAEWLVIMNNGRIKAQGTPEELLDSGELGDDDLVKSSVMSSRNQSTTNLESLVDKNEDLKSKAAIIDAKLAAVNNASIGNTEELPSTDGKLVEGEEKAEGVVGLEVYAGYAKMFGGLPIWSFVIFIFCASQGIFMIQSWWLRNWSLHSEQSASVNLMTFNNAANLQIITNIKSVPGFALFFGALRSSSMAINGWKEENSTLYYITIYGLIGFAYAVSGTFRNFVTFFSGIKASNRIFKQVLERVLRAKLRFFDKTPQGRIMNRFSKDIESVDQELTPFGEGVFICIVQCVFTLVLITVITPDFLFFAFIIGLLYYIVGILYITLSRELKRFESITKSPIHQHFAESLSGVATIRAYGVEARFMKHNLNAIDTNNKPFFYLWVANRWLAFRIDAVGSLVMFFSGVFVLFSSGKIDAGMAGLSLSYAIAFSECALWIVRLYSNVEMNMNSVERLQEYLKIEQEPPYEIPETEPPASWPEKGEISVKNISLRYAKELPRVINDVSFEVKANQKVGIVGRTGAGKSTIITAFFRFLDPEEGNITIDGIDIGKIGLRNLRQAITIIPQDPTLFSGTIRSNLDPFGLYSDEAIFEALRRTNLISKSTEEDGENQNKFKNLDSPITEGGGNLSQGERQLVCLSRSLLKNPKVMMLDEATSSIDYKSDSIIQKTIREEFSNSTILTIAHRLRTIIDYDMILVLDHGKVVEYDNPYVLIADKNSLFYSMCENSGELEALIKLAKEAFIEKKNNKNKNKNKKH